MLGWTLFLFVQEECKGEEMNTQTESTAIESAAAGREEVIPLQERSCVQVAESVEEAAEAVLTASRLEVQEEAGRTFAALFVP
jgi:hypothetical protein